MAATGIFICKGDTKNCSYPDYGIKCFEYFKKESKMSTHSKHSKIITLQIFYRNLL